MSIVSLATDAESRISIEDVRGLAADLGIEIPQEQDAQDYLLLLKSFEAVMQSVEAATDYIHPAVQPQDVVGGPRTFRTVEAKDNPMNAWSHRCEFKATKPASALLAGRSIVVKDNICVGGLPTTLGTFPQVLSGGDGAVPISPIDATVVARVLAAGAVITGSSTCENFCASPLSWTSASGPVHHPRLHGYTSGGSSSGSCALVSARLLPDEARQGLGETAELALGGDQAGSIRIPASYCGIYGLKPTFGLVPYTGAASMTPMIDHLGPIAATLEDVAALLKVIAGYDGIDPRMTPESPTADRVKDYPALLAAFRSRPRGKPLLVGVLTESFGIPSVAANVRDTVLHAARTYFAAAGAEVVDVSVPMHTEAPVIWTASTRPSMAEWLCQGKPSGHLSFLAPHLAPEFPPRQDNYERFTAGNPAVMNIVFSGALAQKRNMAALEAKAHRKVFELRAAYDRALQTVDVLVTPCAPTIAMPHPASTDADGRPTSILAKLDAAIGLTSNTCPFNVTGHPAMNAPCGTLSRPEHPEVQLPVGMQIVGRRWEDETVLMAAALLEEGRAKVEKDAPFTA